MAVALGETVKDTKHLWLFRNKHRTLWVIDLREYLGQVFFCSTPDIWQDAIVKSKIKIMHKQKLIELPPEEIWHLSVNNKNPYVKSVDKYKVSREIDDYFTITINNIKALQTTVCNAVQENSLSSSELNDIFYSIERINNDVKSLISKMP
jgi:hypothetical protein